MKRIAALALASGFAFAPAYGQAPGVPAEESDGAEEAGETDPSQRVRCQIRRVTGSNARRIRTCLTVAEWAELARSGNRDARRVVDEATRDSINRNLDPGT
ncbi:MAG: hypothetical protein ACTS1X_02715 [Parasphingopyxis sp.]